MSVIIVNEKGNNIAEVKTRYFVICGSVVGAILGLVSGVKN